MRFENKDYRARGHLEVADVEALADAAKADRYGARDSLMIMMAFRHGLRIGELTDLRWSQVSFDEARAAVEGQQAQHPCHPGRRAAGAA